VVTVGREDEEEQFTVGPDLQEASLPTTPERPRRVIVKPARFRWVRNTSDDDSDWYQPTDELKEDCASYLVHAERIQPASSSNDAREHIQPPTDSTTPEQSTIDQPTPYYAIDRNEDILEMSPDIEIDIDDDEPIIELTMHF